LCEQLNSFGVALLAEDVVVERVAAVTLVAGRKKKAAIFALKTNKYNSSFRIVKI
jgi:hypothetical protein